MPRLSLSSAVYRGSTPALKVYRGSTQAWASGGGGGGATPTTDFWFSAEGASVGAFASTVDTYGIPFSAVTAGSVQYVSGGKGSTVALGCSAGSGSGFVQWNRPTAAAQHSMGMWVQPGAVVPTVDARVLDMRETDSANTVGGLLWTTTGRFRIMQGSSGLTTGQSPVFAAGTWYWVALTWDCTAKVATLMVYDEAGGLLHDSGSVALTSAYAALTTTRWVRPAISDIGNAKFDDLQWQPGSVASLPPWGGTTTPPGDGVPAGYSAYPPAAATFDAGCEAAVNTYLPAATYTFNDFTQINVGYYGAGLTTCAWLKGAGKANTFIRMNSNTSTKASAVAALASGSTNPYYFLKIGSGSGRGGGPLIKFEDFTLTGTSQGHVYNGLRMDYGAIGSVIRNVKVTGIPGNASSPPGETFAVNLYDCLNVAMENCEIDGRLNETGSPVTASMLGLNNSDHASVIDTTFRYCGVGFPVAAWQCTDGDFTRCTFSNNNRVPIHIENCDGVWNFRNCMWTNTSEFHGVFAATANWASGEAVVNIYDPVYDNFKGDGLFWWRIVLWAGLSYNTDVGSGTTPRAINLYINGVLRPDLLYVQRDVP